MPVERATIEDLPAIRRLLRMARHSYCNVADEDLGAVVGRGLTLLYGHQGLPSALIMADPEVRPRTLPEDAPTRVQVRALAIRNSGWYGSMLPELLDAVKAHAFALLEGYPAVLHSFASELWLGPALASIGFSQIETVIYFRKDRLNRLPPESALVAPARLRGVLRGELPDLAVLDVASFGPFWHMGEAELSELLFRGRMVVACSDDGTFVGYSALLNGTREEAHLARIAVHPEWQGRGVGRLLLQDTVEFCREQGCLALGLNTQLSNQRSQALYRAAGFRESGLALPVYTLKLA